MEKKRQFKCLEIDVDGAGERRGRSGRIRITIRPFVMELFMARKDCSLFSGVLKRSCYGFDQRLQQRLKLISIEVDDDHMVDIQYCCMLSFSREQYLSSNRYCP